MGRCFHGPMFEIVKPYVARPKVVVEWHNLKEKIKMLKATPKNDPVVLNTVVRGKIVTVDHTVKVKKDDPSRFNLRWRIDFTGMEPAEILKLAARTLVIKKQGDWRKAKDQTDEKIWDQTNWKAVDIMAEGRQAADPIDKAYNLASKGTKAEREALIKKLIADMK